MSQNWPAINGGDKLAVSRADILTRDETLKSNNSGTGFPTTNLSIGMLCYRSDVNQLFELEAITPETEWVMIADLNVGFFNKGGDTMQGALKLAADPVADLEAVTKRYADAIKAAAVQISGSIMSGPLTLSGNPTANLHATPKQYVDGKAIAVGTGTPLAVAGTLGTGITLFHAGQSVSAGTYGSTSAIPVVTVDQYGHVTSIGQANLSLSNLLGKYGDTAQEIYNNGWYRSYGSTGWFSQTYGGGIYMYDTSAVRVYGGKAFSTDWHNFAGGGSIWTSAYGWLQDYFAGKAAENQIQSAGALNSGTGGVVAPASFYLQRSGNQVQLVRVFGNCNCDCACGCCFPAGVPILMADGTYRPVERVKVGDWVMGAEGPEEVWDVYLTQLGNRRMFEFEGDDSGLKWSEEHLFWAKRAGKQWWWSADADSWRAEQDLPDAVPGLRDNFSIFEDPAEHIEFAHITGWRRARLIELAGYAPDTRLYLPKTRRTHTVIAGKWLATAGTDEFSFDYHSLDWKGLK